jgi:acyl carrier protein
MNQLSYTDVKKAICDIHRKVLLEMGYNLEEVPDDLDLLQQGIIDSLGILELITQLELRLQVNIDLEQLPAEELTLLGALSRHVAASSKVQGPG